MDYPQTTHEDIEDEKPIDIIGKVINSKTFDDGDEIYFLQDVEGNDFELKIWPSETDNYNIKTDSWYLFQNAAGDVYQGDRNLGSNWGNMEAISLDEPPEFAEIDKIGEKTVEPVEGGVLALDIETISAVPETKIELDNSDHVELLCIGIGFSPEVGVPGDSSVLFRKGSGTADEVDLLERFCDYVETHDPDQLVLFKGDFDLQHLPGRAERVDNGAGISDRVNELFNSYDIVNLNPPGSLEDNFDVLETYWDIYHHSLDPATWRKDHPRYRGELSDPVVTNKDIPYFGERYLQLRDEGEETREYRALHELLRHYTVSDIQPLFEMIQQPR